MEYNKESHIATVKDVEVFFNHLLEERKVSFHPDDDFADYVNMETGEPTFTPDEVLLYNRLMDESFEVCEKNNVEIYELGLNKLLATI